MSAEAVRYLRAVDPTLAAVIDAVGPFAPLRREPTFATLVATIIGQQISTRAAAAIDQRLRERLGGTVTPDTLLAASDEDLRRAGLSRAKLTAVRDVAQRVAAGELIVERLSELDDETVIAHLSKSRGIGRWTAQMFLIFALGREDVLPLDDYGFRAAVRRLYGAESARTPAALAALGERWRPYRSVATWYLWRSLALPIEHDYHPPNDRQNRTA
ncbi:MAG: DNA-3-methyladenine glycosylase [Chloroflexota bacterium]|nr:DNA-3-methyladenine glycosylase [Dehalococcoidia bacterium]MDW8254650.1 DNA-3-methyladenine glycosylase [Chloroflexota bacterium]